MKTTVQLLLAYCLLLASSGLMAQGISINATGASPDPSAMLDVVATDKGLLIPRLTSAQRDAISNPATGLQVFNTDTGCMNLFDGATWKQACYECAFAQPVAANNGPLCENATLNLTASTISGATYSWTGPNGFSSSSQNPSIANVTTAAAGTYALVVSANGCTASAVYTTVTINAAPSSPPASNNGPVCAGQTLNLSASFISGATYSWTGPNGFVSNAQNPSISNISLAGAGAYQVSASVNGCSSSASSTTVVVNALPDATFSYSPTSPYETQSVSFTPATSGAPSYAWTFASGSTSSSSAQNPSSSWSSAGTYAVKLILTDNNSCTDSSSVNVTVDPIPFKRAFVTSTSYNGNLGGVAGADAKCQARADAVSLGGTWKAWLSAANTAQYASARLNQVTVPYKMLDGTTIANNWADLVDGNLASNFNINEFGATVSAFVWTNSTGPGTAVNGTSGFDCVGWTGSTTNGSIGVSTASAAGTTTVATNERWTWADPGGCLGGAGRCYMGCGSTLRLYCLEQ